MTEEYSEYRMEDRKHNSKGQETNHLVSGQKVFCQRPVGLQQKQRQDTLEGEHQTKEPPVPIRFCR